MRKLTVILLCMAMILMLAACGSSASGDQAGAGSAQSEGAAAAQDAGGGSGENAGAGQADNVSPGKGSADSGSSGGTAAPAAASGAVAELEKKYIGLKEDGLKWEYNSSSQTVVISGEGAMRDYSEEVPAWDTYAGEAKKVVIGDEVTSIGAGAFMYFTALEEAELGKGIEFIGNAAFTNCSCLRTVNFPENLKYVGHYAFNEVLLHSDSGFAFPEGMLYLGESSFDSAFKENTVTIPASLSVIGTGAFANMFVSAFIVDPANPSYASVDGVLYDKNITTLINYPADKHDKTFEIPGTVTTILKDALETTNDLEKIVIPASVQTIEECAFFWNYGLKGFEVDAANTCYKAVDGVLYSADGKLLLSYPLAAERTEYTVPAGTERIAAYAVSQAKNLTELHTEEGLLEIGDTAFYLCVKLTSAGLPASLQKIGERAFQFCDGLTEIRFAGTSADWQKVEIGENNELLSDGSVTIYCAE